MDPLASSDFVPDTRIRRGDEDEVTLVASDGQSVVVPYGVLKESDTLAMLVNDLCFIEGASSTIHLPITFACTRRVVDYLKHKKEYALHRGEIPDFSVSPNETLDLLEVSAFLRI